MLIHRLLPLALLFLTLPSIAQAQSQNRGFVEEPSPESTQNNSLNGNLNNGNGNSNSDPTSPAEAPEQDAPMAPVLPDSAIEPTERQPPVATPEGESAGSQPPMAAPGEAAPETQGPTERQIPEAPAERTLAGKPMPVRGMTMQEVEKQFGQPQEKRPAVGKPPIIRWVYADYIVYFERQYVLHSVPNETVPTQH